MGRRCNRRPNRPAYRQNELAVRSTVELLLDLVRQGRELLIVELSLVRAELTERGSSISSGVSAVVVGLALVPIGFSLIFVAASLFIARFGVPPDLAFLIVALVVIAAGMLALRFGIRSLGPSRLMPAKSISQISSLLGG
jgi:Putative Actinobacterial Holin-X, holin superfamily III